MNPWFVEKKDIDNHVENKKIKGKTRSENMM
jgi:hypothetical protein